MACTEKPDVVLLDLRMPGSHGEEVIECLRLNALTRHIPIIVLSGSQEYGVRQRVLAEGADCFLRKPTPFLQILEAVVGLASGNAPQDFP
jgi:CheY-like chemotaxis protein